VNAFGTANPSDPPCAENTWRQSGANRPNDDHGNCPAARAAELALRFLLRETHCSENDEDKYPANKHCDAERYQKIFGPPPSFRLPPGAEYWFKRLELQLIYPGRDSLHGFLAALKQKNRMRVGVGDGPEVEVAAKLPLARSEAGTVARVTHLLDQVFNFHPSCHGPVVNRDAVMNTAPPFPLIVRLCNGVVGNL